MNVHLGRTASVPDGLGRLVSQLASYSRVGSFMRMLLSDPMAAQSGSPRGWAYPSQSELGMHAPIPKRATVSPGSMVRTA